jgi:DNA gyrase/topoisomerase IV subunit B
MAKKQKTYDESSIEFHEGLDGVRKRPNVYLGGKDSAAVTHAVIEIIGNAVDEATAGYGKEIGVHVDGTKVVIWDHGRGVPYGPHPKHKGRSTLEIIFTELNAGGKFNAKSYKTAIGVHGMGAAVANAVSKTFSVWSFRGAECGHQSYKEGKPVAALKKLKMNMKTLISGKVLPSWATVGKTGTVVAFDLDLSVFEKGAKLDTKALHKWLDNLSWFLPKVTFNLAVAGRDAPGKFEKISRPNGLTDRFFAAATALKAEPVGEPYKLGSENVDAMVGWLAGTSDNSIHSAVNAVETSEHGTHYAALIDTVFEALKEQAKRGDNFTKDSLRVGLVAVVNIRMSEAEFSGQAKAKLTSPSAKETVRSALTTGKTSIFDFFKKNKALTRQIIDRANALSHLNDSFKAGQKLAATLKTETRGKSLLPASLKNASTKDANKRVLFLVEGESALGSCLAARDTETDEVLPLTGKIPNVWRDPGKVATNEILIDILKSIGFDPKTQDSFRVGKVVLLMDADVDGLHLTALVLGMLHKIAPLLLKSGRVFVVDAPLFIYRTEREVMHCLSRADAMRRIKEKGGKFDPDRLQRVKGWGEISPEILRDVAFDPSTRKFAKVTGAESVEALSMLDGLLGDDPATRKQLLNV